MSTTMRNLRLPTQGEPISRRKSAETPSWRRSLTDLEHWAAAKPGIASLTLTIAYLVALAALVAVLAASALNSVLGMGVLVLFAAMLLICMAVGVYTIIPEHQR
jgi:Flp pilus assembly protein TadB